MNIQNKPNIYTISNSAPPSYAEATGLSTSRTYNSELDQRYPHVAVRPSPSVPFPYPYPSNCYLNSTTVQSAYPQYESAQRQNQPMSIPINRPIVTGNREYKTCSRLFQFVWLAVSFAAIVGVLTLIIRAAQS